MTKYIRLLDSLYPITEREIKAAFPNTTFAVPFKKDGYAVVFETPQPEATTLQIVIEGSPQLTVLGTWEQTWSIKDKFEDISGGLTKAEQEAIFLANEFDSLKESIQKSINSLFTLETAVIKGNVMQEEIDTFSTQEKEALAYQADNQTSVPLLSGLAAIRNITVAELVNRVLTNATNYKTAMVQIMGKKHKLEDQLRAAITIEDLKAIVVE